MNATNKDNAMKHCLMIFVCVLGLTSAITTSAYDTKAKSLLWRVTSKTGATSYVFGTIHLRDTAIFRQRDSVVILLQKCRHLYAEIDLDSVVPGSFDPTKLVNTGGKTLRDLYSPSDYAKIKSVLSAKLGPMAAFADMLKPSAIVALLAMDSFEQNTTMGMDEFLWSRAKRYNVPRAGVEKVDEQLALLDSMPPSILLDYVTTMDHQDSLGATLIHSYVTEDLAAVGDLMKEMDDWQEFGTAINDDRNARMVKRLATEFQKGQIMLAVGALHLPGKNGILSRLERAGFRVTPVLGGKRINLLEGS